MLPKILRSPSPGPSLALFLPRTFSIESLPWFTPTPAVHWKQPLGTSAGDSQDLSTDSRPPKTGKVPSLTSHSRTILRWRLQWRRRRRCMPRQWPSRTLCFCAACSHGLKPNALKTTLIISRRGPGARKIPAYFPNGRLEKIVSEEWHCEFPVVTEHKVPLALIPI